ncbi:MAG: ABC transporter substrate-binding protein [Oscillospiraceae bacterium]|nr:ABC transporter substrate-binding protein [Oscillospiraceae bacterium]
MKRLIPLLLAAAMLLALAACTVQTQAPDGTTPPPAQSQDPTVTENTGNVTTETPPPPDPGIEAITLSPDDPTTLSITMITNEAGPNANNRLSQLLKDELGVTLEYELIGRSVAAEKISIMLVDGVFSDIIGSRQLSLPFHEAGALIPLDDYLFTPDGGSTGLFPLLTEHVYPYRDQLSWQGKFYCFPDYNRFYGGIPENDHWMTAFWLQKSVLEEFGFPATTPVSLETYFGWIEEYIAKYPTIDGMQTVGFTFPMMPGNKEYGIMNAPLHLTGHPNEGIVAVDDRVVSIYALEDYAKDYYQFLNAMDKKGLVYRETYSLTTDRYYELLSSGRVLGMFDQGWNIQTPRQSLNAADKSYLTWAPVEIVYDGYTPWYGDIPVMNYNQGLSVSITAEKNGTAEKALAFINHLLEEKWQKRMAWGIEDEDYQVGEDGLYYRTQKQIEDGLDQVWRANNLLMALRDLAPKRQGFYTNGNAYDPATQATEFYNALSDYDREFLSQYNVMNWRAMVTSPLVAPAHYPAWNIPLPDGSPERIAEAEMLNIAVEMLPQAIQCPEDQFETVWATYQARLAQVDLDILRAFIQAGVDEKYAPR